MLRGAERVELLTFFPLDVATQPREPCWGVCVQSLGLTLGYAAVLVILIFRRPEASAQEVSTSRWLTQNLSQAIPFRDYFVSLGNEKSLNQWLSKFSESHTHSQKYVGINTDTPFRDQCLFLNAMQSDLPPSSL